MTLKVYVVGGHRWCGPSTVSMFKDAGWDVVGDEILKTDPNSVDLVVFTGGSDVSPELYGEENIASSCDPMRDRFEVEVYSALKPETKKAGICRGGQFLAVMNGDKLIQHHGYQGGTNPMYGPDGFICPVNVCHHQGFVTTKENGGEVLAWIKPEKYKTGTVPSLGDGGYPSYSSFYPKTNSYCFQPHAEWGHQPSHDYFFRMLTEHLGLVNEPMKRAA